MKKYLFDTDVWNNFLKSYLTTKNNVNYKNNISLNRILTSLPPENILKYMYQSECKLNNLSTIIQEGSDEDLKQTIKSLIEYNKIEFNSNNIHELIKLVGLEETIKFLSNNVDANNFQFIILSSNLDLYNLILYYQLPDKLLNCLAPLSNKKFDTIDRFTQSQIKILIEHNQVECNNSVIQTLKENDYLEEINLLLKTDDNFE